MKTALDSNESDILGLLSLDCFDESIDWCLKRLSTHPDDLCVQFYLGLALLLAGQEEDAQGVWLETLLNEKAEEISRNEALENFLTQEALRRLNANKLYQAELIIYYLLEINDLNGWAYKQLGKIFFVQNKIEDAINSYIKFLSVDNNDDAGVILNLGALYKKQNKIEKAEEYFLLTVSKGFYLEEAFYNLSQIYKSQGEEIKSNYYHSICLAINGQYQEASENLKTLAELGFQSERLYWTLFECYRRMGENAKALECIERGIRNYPENLTVLLKNKLAVPLIYDNEDEIKFYRERFNSGLNELILSIKLDSSEERQQALKALESHNNFFLAYQGHNDLCLQKKYGSFVHQVMKSNFPCLSKIKFEKNDIKRKIKIAYISNHFRHHTVCKLFKGWINLANKEKFEIFTYYLDKICDSYTDEIRINSDYFYHFPSGFETICENIIDNKIDIIVYPEIGMDFRVIKLAGLRLAPVQCMAWGHPVTSGLPTIDYFLSSQLMEPDISNQHYYEKLICLKNLSISYEMPMLPEQILTREHFNLDLDSVVYLSCQSTFKYLPQYDYIFASIAQKVPKAKFIFIAFHSAELTEKFKKRVGRHFLECGLNVDDYCIIMPPLDPRGYFSLNLISDIFLDTLDWSGGNTTLEALACDLPVVTYPSQLMRGRHAYAMLKRMGITETIADSLSEYIKIAVQLGINENYRKQICDEVKRLKNLLFNDVDSILDLEKFYEESISAI